VVSIPGVVMAKGLENPLRNGIDSISAFVEALIKVALYILYPLAVLAILYSGFLFVFARGNSTKLDNAKKNVLWTFIGVSLLVGAWALSQLLQGTIDPLLNQ